MTDIKLTTNSFEELSKRLVADNIINSINNPNKNKGVKMTEDEYNKLKAEAIENERLMRINSGDPDVVCNCECHYEGACVMHCMPCCNLTYETYFDEKGVFDNDKYLKLVNLKKL